MATELKIPEISLDYIGDLVVGLAAFMLADALVFDGAIAPDFIRPAIGWIVCGGAAVLAFKAARKR